MGLYPRHFAALGADLTSVETFTRTVRDYAVAYGIAGKRETYKLAVLCLAQGAHVFHDPRFGALTQRTLAQINIRAERRVELFSDGIRSWARATWEGVSLADLGARLIERVSRHGDTAVSRDTVAAALHGLVLQSPAMAPPAIRATFLDAALAQADGYGLRAPHRRLAYVGGSFLHGVYWFDDPLMAGLRAAVESAGGPHEMCTEMVSIYDRFA